VVFGETSPPSATVTAVQMVRRLPVNLDNDDDVGMAMGGIWFGLGFEKLALVLHPQSLLVK
jgi:hypothetical protein